MNSISWYNESHYVPETVRRTLGLYTKSPSILPIAVIQYHDQSNLGEKKAFLASMSQPQYIIEEIKTGTYYYLLL